MSHFTSAEIFSKVWEYVRRSELSKHIPVMYPDHYPNQSKGKFKDSEFIVMTSLANSSGSSQVATVVVNIYVPDDTPTINGEEQRYPDRTRLSELTRIAYRSLEGYPVDERWFFDISDESIISEDKIPYTFSSIKVKFKKY